MRPASGWRSTASAAGRPAARRRSIPTTARSWRAWADGWPDGSVRFFKHRGPDMAKFSRHGGPEMAPNPPNARAAPAEPGRPSVERGRLPAEPGRRSAQPALFVDGSTADGTRSRTRRARRNGPAKEEVSMTDRTRRPLFELE